MGITALFAGSTGLQANSAALDVVGNNLANLNTSGYKTQRTLFQDAVYQSLSVGSPGTAGTGGTNPTQIGFGVVVGQVGTEFLQGTVTPTGRNLDAAIQGAGYFVLNNGNQTKFTRAGAFDIDANGFLVDPSTGYFVQRYGNVGEATATTPGFQTTGDTRIKVPFGAGIVGIPTTTVNYQGNISSTLTVGQSKTTSMQVFDSLSSAQTLNVTFTKSAANTYDVTATINGATITLPATPTQITFDNTGLLLTPASGTITIGVSGLPGTNAQNIVLNLGAVGQATGLTQFGGVSTAAAVTQDGLASGVLTSVTIDNNGNLQGQFSNGRTIPLAQLAIAGFNNEGGLIRTGSNYFQTGPASGEPLVGVARDGGRGGIQGSALEGSNVDVSIEFSRLIIAQRGYQINAKTVSAANEQLQTLAQIIQ